MNKLAAELVKGILSEAEMPRKEVVGMFGGGFKPPTVGHLEVVQRALNQNPELDKLIVLVGSGERDSITQDEALKIWRIYQKYLPSKVEVQPAPEGKPPIKAIYNYGKDNPDKDVYWIIGAREGNEGDFEDIQKRTKGLRKGEHPNISVKQITTPDSVSGTKARQALLARNKEEFIQFLPDIPEVDEIWNMLSSSMDLLEIGIKLKNFTGQVNPGDTIAATKGAYVYGGGRKNYLKRRKVFKVVDNDRLGVNRYRLNLEDNKGNKFFIHNYEMDGEYKGKKIPQWSMVRDTPLKERVSFSTDFISQGDVEFVDDMADRKLAPIDVDLTGNHFFDRLNDPRNFPDISIEELEEFFDKLSDEKEKFIEFLRKYKDVVVKDTESNLNIPFMKRANKAIAKTIMRKKNFMTSNQVLPLDEGRYDAEVTMISRMIINFFKDTLGEKVSETFEDAGELKGEPYDLIVDFIPSTFKKLGPLPFIVNAAGSEDDIAIQIDYQEERFPGAYDELIPELKDAIRHELEHVAQYRFNKDASPGDINQDDLPLVDYLTLDYEIPAFVQGIYKNAKTRKISFSQALQNFLDERIDELTPAEEAKVKKAYLDYARKNLPAAQIDENGQKISDKNMDDYKKQNNPSGKVKDPFGINAFARELALGLEEGRKKKKDPKKGTGKKPKGSGRRLYTDEDPKDTVRIKFSTRQDIVNTLNKKSFKAKSHARQSQIINLIHQRVRAALSRAKDPAVKKRLNTAFEYIKKRKEASKAKTKRLQAQKKKKKANEAKSGFSKGNVGTRYRAIYKKGGKFYYDQEDALGQGIRQTFGPFKTKAAAKKKMQSFAPAINYRDITENIDPKAQKKYGGKSAPFGSAYKPVKESFTNGDLMPSILALTQYMGSNGLNLKPYPKLKFISNNKENAENILGRTAYYDPNQRLIALYTMDRHPKDILRSYAHELVHHHQNLNNTLDHSQTTNTNEDGDLDKIEREAYETGNILFRNWEDSIKN